MPDVRSGLDPIDYRYINPTPDPDFSPERNRAIIAETIRDVDRFNNDYLKAVDDEGKNRLDILTHFAMYTLNKGGSKTIKQYLGKHQYEALIGEKILSKLRVASTINTLNGNTKFKKGILL